MLCIPAKILCCIQNNPKTSIQPYLPEFEEKLHCTYVSTRRTLVTQVTLHHRKAPTPNRENKDGALICCCHFAAEKYNL